jgi:hypothetical protein
MTMLALDGVIARGEIRDATALAKALLTERGHAEQADSGLDHQP